MLVIVLDHSQVAARATSSGESELLEKGRQTGRDHSPSKEGKKVASRLRLSINVHQYRAANVA
jgi:hypothetical protein